jgi:hypothetical protein
MDAQSALQTLTRLKQFIWILKTIGALLALSSRFGDTWSFLASGGESFLTWPFLIACSLTLFVHKKTGQRSLTGVRLGIHLMQSECVFTRTQFDNPGSDARHADVIARLKSGTFKPIPAETDLGFHLATPVISNALNLQRARVQLAAPSF